MPSRSVAAASASLPTIKPGTPTKKTSVMRKQAHSPTKALRFRRRTVIDGSGEIDRKSGTPEILLGGLLAERALDHRRPGGEDLARTLHHHRPVGEDGAPGRPAGSRAEHGADDGHFAHQL